MDGGCDGIDIDPVPVALDQAEHAVDHALRQQMRLEPEIEQLRVRGMEIVFFVLDPGIFQSLGNLDGLDGGLLDHGRHITHGKGLGELVEDPELTLRGRVLQGQRTQARVSRMLSMPRV